MHQLIAEYEANREALRIRIHELEQALRNPGLQNQEREKLRLRCDMLMTERTELLHAIRDMRMHLKTGGNP